MVGEGCSTRSSGMTRVVRLVGEGHGDSEDPAVVVAHGEAASEALDGDAHSGDTDRKRLVAGLTLAELS